MIHIGVSTDEEHVLVAALPRSAAGLAQTQTRGDSIERSRYNRVSP